VRDGALAIPDLAYGEAGLVPVIAADARTGDVLMLAWANAEAIRLTAETRVAHFWSRSRATLWRKGATSGHEIDVAAILADCDRDAALYAGVARGPACHTGTRTCFGDAPRSDAGVLARLVETIHARRGAPPDESYTARLLAAGPNAVLKKIGEEATELALALRAESDERVAEEAADLLYHVLVGLESRGVAFSRVIETLAARRRTAAGAARE
jgi:phosphoribosyl-ATP pyrophosphohydrolase/phosphoribosyl-AMP cyclohydrolase